MARPLITLALTLGLAACGGEGSGRTTVLHLATDPEGALAFDKDSLEAPAGEVTIELTNDAPIPHDVSVEDNGVEESSPTAITSTASLTVELEPGTYTFFCSVANHREAGMEGTFTIE
jgi:plastocyanin